MWSLEKILAYLVSIGAPIQSNRLRIYKTALDSLGIDNTPNDIIPDEVGCMEAVDTIHRMALGYYINGKRSGITVSTYQGWRIMRDSALFTAVDRPMEGDILIYPSGTGNGNLSNGHVFICGKVNINEPEQTKLMSNSSASGTFEQNYTVATAKARYETLGGYKGYWFRPV